MVIIYNDFTVSFIHIVNIYYNQSIVKESKTNYIRLAISIGFSLQFNIVYQYIGKTIYQCKKVCFGGTYYNYMAKTFVGFPIPFSYSDPLH